MRAHASVPYDEAIIGGLRRDEEAGAAARELLDAQDAADAQAAELLKAFLDSGGEITDASGADLAGEAREEEPVQDAEIESEIEWEIESEWPEAEEEWEAAEAELSALEAAALAERGEARARENLRTDDAQGGGAQTDDASPQLTMSRADLERLCEPVLLAMRQPVIRAFTAAGVPLPGKASQAHFAHVARAVFFSLHVFFPTHDAHSNLLILTECCLSTSTQRRRHKGS